MKIELFSTSIQGLLEAVGINGPAALAIERLVILGVIVVLAVLANWVARRLIVRFLHAMFRRSRMHWDDVIADRGVLLRLGRVAPALVVYFSGELIAPGLPWIGELVRRVTTAWIVLAATFTVDSAIDAFHDLYREKDFSKKRPIKGLVQLGKVVLFVVATVVVITTILDQSPVGILGGLGAMSAVLLLIFRDSILGFVSGIQLSANNMVQIGDWIEMPKYDANGDVIDITLQTIKVQNWDKTITSIPVYALTSDSFRNWRGMSESGGRRVKRAINIDMRTVRFVDDEMLARYRRFSRIRGYIEERQKEIDRYNQEHEIDLTDSVSGRRMTNLGIFRAYVQAYLRSHSAVRQDMTLFVRHLAPQSTGIPVEVYFFSTEQRWVEYESIQADVFDHLLAIIPEFDLRVFQEPSGSELQTIADALRVTAVDESGHHW